MFEVHSDGMSTLLGRRRQGFNAFTGISTVTSDCAFEAAELTTPGAKWTTFKRNSMPPVQ